MNRSHKNKIKLLKKTKQSNKLKNDCIILVIIISSNQITPPSTTYDLFAISPKLRYYLHAHQYSFHKLS